MIRSTILLTFAPLLLLACGTDHSNSSSSDGIEGFDETGSPPGADGSTPGDPPADLPDQGSSNPDPEPETDSGDEDPGPDLKFDVGLGEAGEAEIPEAPCGVDILFVIDNSGSMSQHKEDIVAAFDSFIDEMIVALEPETPVHVAVTRATGFFDPGDGSGWGAPGCEFGYLDGIWNPPDQADNGVNGQQGRLYKQGDKRYFEFEVGEDPGPLGAWFHAALAGAIAASPSSNSESVVAAAAYPFHPANAVDNAGFLREKAVLVLFLLSDAPDATPAFVSTDELIALVSDAKAGCGDGCVLPTGVVQSTCYDQPDNTNTRLTDFMHGFGAPPVAIDFFNGNNAPGSFTSVLGATLAESIAYTCEAIVPEG